MLCRISNQYLNENNQKQIFEKVFAEKEKHSYRFVYVSVKPHFSEKKL